MNPHRLIGLCFLSLAMVAVGSTVIASKLISGGLPPFTATVLRFAIATPVFLVIILATGQKLPRIPPRDWGLLVIQAGLGSVCYTVFLILGVSLTTGANASVVVGTLPVVMGILAITMFREPLTRRFLLTLLISISGVLLVTFQGATAQAMPSGAALIGICFILMAVVCEAVFMLLNKKLQTPLTAMVQAGLMSGLGLVIALLPAGYEVATGMVSAIEPRVILSVAYYALFPTLIGSTLWYAGALRTTASEAALTTAIMPVAALGLSVLVLGEAVSSKQIIGCALVVCAILVGVRRTAP
jgi:drug/metabolite transporter (DMT)-like permease